MIFRYRDTKFDIFFLPENGSNRFNFFLPDFSICELFVISREKFNEFLSEYLNELKNEENFDFRNTNFKKIHKIREGEICLYSIDFIGYIGLEVNTELAYDIMECCKKTAKFCEERPGAIDILLRAHYVSYIAEKQKKNIYEGYIYIIESQGLYKIGKAIDLKVRQQKYVTENPHPIRLVHSYKAKDYTREEKRLHEKFKKKRQRGEWFRLNERDLKYIISSSEEQ